MIEDITAFSDLLIRNKGNTTVTQRARLLGVSTTTVNNWEGLRDIITVPKEEKLPVISEVYQINTDELRKAWKASKNAMHCVLNAKKDTISRTSNGTGLSGSIAKTRTLGRTNSQVGFSRYR